MGKSFDYGFAPKIHSIHGWTIGGTHKLKYRVLEADYPKVNRQYLYVQCNCSRYGYDHDAEASDIYPSYADVLAAASPSKEANLDKGNKND